MNRILLSVAVLALSIGSTFAQDRVYEARKTTSPPTIDGMMTSETEWAGASDAQAEWTLLRSNGNENDAPDDTNNRIQALWDDAGVYLLHQVDYGFWEEDRGFGSVEFGYENINLYFDPNTDGETNDQTGPDDTGVDGYQLAWNQPFGQSEYSEDNPDLGIFQEAHVNANFGNQGAHEGFFGLQIMQTTSDEEDFGFSEIFIPWEDFNASDPEIFDPEFDDIGLFHPFAPVDGDEWFFNIARIETGGSLPAWVAEPGANFFAARPHGVLRFVDSAPGEPCDVNQDGECTGADIDTLAAAIRNGETDARYDLNGDGAVNAADKDFLIEDVTTFFTYYGDSNLDGQFNSSDFVSVFTKGQYEDAVDGNSIWDSGDWNGDLDFDSSDFVRAFTAGGFEEGPRGAAMAIPEPSSMVLLLIGLLAVVRRRR